MLNIIRADFYRLRHSKGFYITQLILIAVVLMTIIQKSFTSIGVISDSLSSFQDGAAKAKWSAVLVVQGISSMASFLIYFLLPLFIMTIGSDFKEKTYKNVLPTGISRGKYFLSKYVIFILLVLFQFVFFYGIAFILGGIKYGVGDINVKILLHLVRTFGVQFLVMNAIFAVPMLVLYITFSNVAAVITTIVFPMIISILAVFLTNITWIKYFSFQSIIDSTFFMELTSNQWSMLIIAACGTIVACVIGSQFVFKRREL